MNRRFFTAALGALGAGLWTPRRAQATAIFEITRTDAEWRAMLSNAEYTVMRREGTERPFSSPLDKNYAPSRYDCRGCDLPLYASVDKYDSKTGWPSFTQSLPGAIGTKGPRSIVIV